MNSHTLLKKCGVWSAVLDNIIPALWYAWFFWTCIHYQIGVESLPSVIYYLCTKSINLHTDEVRNQSTVTMRMRAAMDKIKDNKVFIEKN